MHSQWVKSLDKRPKDRSPEELNLIYSRLRSLRLFRRLRPTVIRELCLFVYVEFLERGVVLFRQGEVPVNWYAVLCGSLDVQVSHTGQQKDVVTLCTLGVGTAFGESVLSGRPHSVSVITSEPCTLLRVRKEDFQELWEKNSHLMEDILNPGKAFNSTSSDAESFGDSGPFPVNDNPNLSMPLTKEPSSQLLRVGWVLRTMLLTEAPHLIRDRKYNLTKTSRKCMVGSELVDWLVSISSSTPLHVHSRSQATAMLQVLVEEGVLSPVANNDYQFLDKYLFYRFWFEGNGEGKECFPPSPDERRIAENELHQSLALLSHHAPDAVFRLILRKPSHERTQEEVDALYEELITIKALSHLTNSVKKELAAVVSFESHSKAGTLLFNQGDVGNSWYVILKGSVNVIIVGKGVVCTLQEGDDFGKLALVNDAPRAATIVTNETNTQLLRVDKEDFNRILRDVEANTVRLKEHGKDVLLLQKIASKSTQQQPSGSGSHYKYMVIAGTPEKMLEHCLETRIDLTNNEEPFVSCSASGSSSSSSVTILSYLDPLTRDTFFEDLLFTHVIFMSTSFLCKHLLNHYKVDQINARQEKEFSIANKKRVVRFTHYWQQLIHEPFFMDDNVVSFVNELGDALRLDSLKYEGSFNEELLIMDSIFHAFKKFNENIESRGTQKWKADLPGPIRRLSFNGLANGSNLVNDLLPIYVINRSLNAIRPKDEIITRVYCADHTYTTLKITMDSTASSIKTMAAEKLGLNVSGDLVLVEVKSTGERLPYKDTEVSIGTCLSVNGRVFVSLVEHMDALTPLPEQEGPKEGTYSILEEFSAQDLAYYFTHYSWSLFQNVHEYELIYQVFGRHNFNQITANLDLFLRNFNEMQHWVVTEVVLCTTLSRRVQLLRKLIKMAGLCKEYQNLNAFFAITMGLSNIAVSRLTQTWERLPSKLKRTFSQYESLIDPSRNHRRYRLFLSKLEPPVIPFTPLLLKDMTFAHEGNKTFLDKGLVNFEKMQMISQTLRTIRFCRSRPFKGTEVGVPGSTLTTSSPSMKKSTVAAKLEQYIKELKVIDNQRVLTQFSHSIEYKKS